MFSLFLALQVVQPRVLVEPPLLRPTAHVAVIRSTLSSNVLLYPLPQHVMVSSPFSLKRWHPILGRYAPHLGIDLAAPLGMTVLAAQSGTVVESGYSESWGNFIVIESDDEQQRTLYAHLKERFVKKGWSVQAGQPIGLVGSTGWSTGAHLHFGVQHWIDGRWEYVPPQI